MCAKYDSRSKFGLNALKMGSVAGTKHKFYIKPMFVHFFVIYTFFPKENITV